MCLEAIRRLLDPDFVGYRMKPGWRGPLPFYRGLCPRHGPYESYPHGYRGILVCPACQGERDRKNSTP